MRTRIDIVILAIAVSAVWARAQESVPAEVRKEMQASQEDCKSSQFLPGFLQKKINNDGMLDYMLDYRKFQCDGSTLLYCGTAGCLTGQSFSLIQVLNELPECGNHDVIALVQTELDELIKNTRKAGELGRAVVDGQRVLEIGSSPGEFPRRYCQVVVNFPDMAMPMPLPVNYTVMWENGSGGSIRVTLSN